MKQLPPDLLAFVREVEANMPQIQRAAARLDPEAPPLPAFDPAALQDALQERLGLVLAEMGEERPHMDAAAMEDRALRQTLYPYRRDLAALLKEAP